MIAPMRLLFVNHAHPNTPHVSGMRFFHFAEAMSSRGHQVVLLTSGDPQCDADPPASRGDLRGRLVDHDWGRPFLLEVRPEPLWSVDAVRGGRLPSVLRRAATAWHFVAHGGVQADWSRAVRPLLPALVATFTPDAVWGTFGNTSNLTLAQGAAGLAGCPWILDIKDNWETFVPFSLRHHMAWRFRKAAGLTSNAEHHLAIAQRWHRQRHSAVVYSGVAECMFHRPSPAPDAKRRHLLLVGGTYSADTLHRFLLGVGAWLRNAPQAAQSEFRLHYAGSDASRVLAAVRDAGLEDRTRVDAQLPLSELATLVHGAFACAYLWAPFGFHHKLLELLVAAKQVIAYPGEHAESRRLAANIDTPFHPCESEAALVDALSAAWDDRHPHPVPGRPQPAWRWRDFAVDLEAVFLKCTAIRRVPASSVITSQQEGGSHA